MDGDEFGSLSNIGVEQINSFGERYFSNLNFISFHNVSANDLYERDFSELFKKNKLYIIVGTDSGLLPKYISHKGLPDGSRYIFIEPSAILSELSSVHALNDSEPNFAFADENTWLDSIEELNCGDYFYINSVTVHYAYCTREDTVNSYTELSWYVPEKMQQLYYEYSAALGNEAFVVQQILNLVDNECSAISLLNAFKGKMAFVLGGGPSLDEALPWLLENRSRVVLLAVSRISKRLLEVGLEPDFFISVDPYSPNFSVSKEIYNFSTKPIFIHSNSVYHPLISQWHGRSLYLDKRFFWKTDEKEEINLHSASPTVSNTALAVALQMGFSRIFLAGVDLCFTKDGFTHAQGSNEYAVGVRFKLAGAEVLTYDNTISPTGLDYHYAHSLLEAQVKDIEKNRLFNISLHAAKVENIEYMPLSEIKLDKRSIDVEAIVGPLLRLNAKENYFHDLQQELNKASYQFQEIKKKAKQALKYNNELYNDDGTIKDYQIKQKLDKLEKQLDKKYSKFSVVVKTFGLRQFLKFTKPVDELRHVSTTEERRELAQELKQRLDVYYGSYLEGCQSLIQLIEQVNQMLIARAEERKERPNWDLIIDSCRKEQAYGRVYIWEKLESAKQLAPKYQAIFAEFKEKFQESLNASQAGHLQKAKQSTSLSLLNQRASSLFKHKKLDTLGNLLLSLDKHHEQDKVVPYRFLIKGYLAELENNQESALQCYEKVLEEGNGPLKEALLRIIHLDFNEQANHGLGHLALECLVQLDPRYLAAYAESSQIQGNIHEAINTYIKYLAIFPEDWQVSLNLAELFYQQKIYEGAELLVSQLLEKHPTQKSALLIKQKLDKVK